MEPACQRNVQVVRWFKEALLVVDVTQLSNTFVGLGLHNDGEVKGALKELVPE